MISRWSKTQLDVTWSLAQVFVDPSHEVLAKLMEIKGTFDFHSATTKYEESLLIGSLDKSTLKLNKACVI